MRATTTTDNERRRKKLVLRACVRAYDAGDLHQIAISVSVFFCLCLFSVGCLTLYCFLNVCQTMSGKMMTVFNNRGFDLFYISFSSHSSIGVDIISITGFRFRLRYFDEYEALVLFHSAKLVNKNNRYCCVLDVNN